ncbi:MAG: Rpp14/Pop5 family protein [Candidatus Bathyarchaeia archaeon]
MSRSLYSEEEWGLLARARRRYILAKINAEKIPDRKDFEKALWGSIIRLFGEYGASQVDLLIIEYNQEGGYIIIRCSHAALPIVRASIAAITKVGDEEVAIYTLLVSGTIKALRRKMASGTLTDRGREKSG